MKRLITIVCTLLLCWNAFSNNVFLLAVGISDYPGTVNDLNLPVADAKAMVDLYKTNRATSTKMLLNANATRKEIIKTASALFKNAAPNDIVVLFFSGHGIPGGFCAYDDFLLYDDIKAIFSNCKSNHKMIFADACFSGRMREPSAGRKRISNDSDVMLFLSSRHNETSLESAGMRNGFFTTCLIKCLKGAADGNHDRKITARELFDSVSKGVIRLSNGHQHPVMWGNFSNNMVVMQW